MHGGRLIILVVDNLSTASNLGGFEYSDVISKDSVDVDLENLLDGFPAQKAMLHLFALLKHLKSALIANPAMPTRHDDAISGI